MATAHNEPGSARKRYGKKFRGLWLTATPDSWTLDDIRPYVEHTIDAFGWNRVVWGSDSPVCTLTGNIETWVAATHALLTHCSAEEKAALLHKNAGALWSIADIAHPV